MKKLLVAIMVMGIFPLTSTAPAEAKVCTWKSRQVKDTTSKSYTFYRYETTRKCSGKGKY